MQRDNKPSETGAVPPKSWIDKDTGHRVWRVSDEPNSGAFYFNVNAFTPDHKQMVYNSPDGIRVLDLATMTTRMVVPNQAVPAPAASAASHGLTTETNFSAASSSTLYLSDARTRPAL
jgi:oligogalacturonide lyase